MPTADLSLLRTVNATGAAKMNVGAGDTRRALTGDKIGRTVAVDVLRGTERLTPSLARKIVSDNARALYNL